LALVTALAGGPKTMSAQAPPQIGDVQPTVIAEQVLQCMEDRIAGQQAALESAHQLRQYHAENRRLHKQATMLVQFDYTAPDKKSFQVLGRSGSASVQKRVFDAMLEAESETGPAAARRTAEINRQNYSFRFLEIDRSNHAFLFEAAPRTDSRYLFRGKVWIDGDDCAVRRIEGEPAQRPSFWVRKTHFVHQYGKFGRFWFPLSNHTDVELRLLGRSEFSIEYFDHSWQERADAAVLPLRSAAAWTVNPLPPNATPAGRR
jgi:hypothetical protein